MAKIYKKHESSPLWLLIEQIIHELEDNDDLEVTTTHEHVIGYFCKILHENNKLFSTQSITLDENCTIGSDS